MDDEVKQTKSNNQQIFGGCDDEFLVQLNVFSRTEQNKSNIEDLIWSMRGRVVCPPTSLSLNTMATRSRGNITKKYESILNKQK